MLLLALVAGFARRENTSYLTNWSLHRNTTVWSASSNGQIVGWDPVTLTPKKEVIISNPDKHSPFKLNLDCMTRVHYFGPCLFVLVLWAYACVIWIYKGKATRNSRPQAKEREDLFFFCVRYCLGLCFVSVGLPVRVFIHSFVRSFIIHSFIHWLSSSRLFKDQSYFSVGCEWAKYLPNFYIHDGLHNLH